MLAKAVCATPVACVPRGRAFVPSQAPAARPRALPLAARRQRVVAAAAATQADTKYPGWEVIYRVGCHDYSSWIKLLFPRLELTWLHKMPVVTPLRLSTLPPPLNVCLSL